MVLQISQEIPRANIPTASSFRIPDIITKVYVIYYEWDDATNALKNNHRGNKYSFYSVTRLPEIRGDNNLSWKKNDFPETEYYCSI